LNTQSFDSGNAGDVNIQAQQNLSVTDNASIYSNANAQGLGGNVNIKGNAVTLDNSSLNTQSFDSGNAGDVNIQAQQNLSVTDNASIYSNANAQGLGGNVNIHGNEITLDQSSVGTKSNNSGNAGGINIQAQQTLSITDNAFIHSKALAEGQSGNINLAGSSVDITNNTSIQMVSSGAGNAGSVIIQATNGCVKLDDTSSIQSSAKSAEVGSIQVSATKDVTLDSSTIFSTTNNFPSTIQVNAGGILLLTGSSLLGTITNGIGNAGEIYLEGGNIKINNSLIETLSNDAGNSGSMTIQATNGSIELSNVSIESYANTASVGPIQLSAMKDVILNNAQIYTHNVIPANFSDSQIEVKAGSNVLLTNNSSIYQNPAPKLFGNINIYADGNVTLQGNHSFIGFAPPIIPTEGNSENVSVTAINNIFLTQGAAINSSSYSNDNPGNIKLAAGNLLSLVDDSKISSQSNGTSNGGNITVTGNVLLMQSSSITADTQAGASGGNITLNFAGVVADGNNIIVGGNQIISPQPGVPGWNIIRAAAPDGISGNIQFTTPQLNLSGTQQGLGGPQFQAEGLGKSFCARNKDSSLSIRSKTGWILDKEDF